MKKIGIVVDNYKLEKMKQELNSQGFNDLLISPFFGDTTTIKVEISDKDYEEKKKKISAIVHLVEYHFKRRN